MNSNSFLHTCNVAEHFNFFHLDSPSFIVLAELNYHTTHTKLQIAEWFFEMEIFNNGQRYGRRTRYFGTFMQFGSININACPHVQIDHARSHIWSFCWPSSVSATCYRHVWMYFQKSFEHFFNPSFSKSKLCSIAKLPLWREDPGQTIFL